MAGYQLVTLTRACEACIKARRKCTRSLPQCQRCSEKKIPCSYKNTPLSSSDGDLTKSSQQASSSERYNHKSWSLYSNRHGRSTPPRDACTGTKPFVHVTASSISLDWKVLKSPEVILTLDESTVNCLKGHLKSFPSTFVGTGGTPFIHPHLYPTGLPPALRLVSELCSMLPRMTSTNRYTIEQVISDTSKAVIQSFVQADTFATKLALVQSLILLNIMTLFSPTVSQSLKQQAENQVFLLRKWTWELYRSVPAYLPASMTPYRAWVLAESCRRTLHIAHMVTGVHSVLTQGCFTLTLFVEALPLERNGHTWEDTTVSSGPPVSINSKEEMDTRVQRGELVSYRELTDMWDSGDIEQPSLFEELLIVACKGVDNVKARILQCDHVTQ